TDNCIVLYKTPFITADDNRKGYPRQPTTLGEHIRKARMDRGELQKDVAEQIGVSKDTICYWENGRVEPEIRYHPAIIDYLGYNPFPEPEDTIKRLEWFKMTNGLAFEGLAAKTGIHSQQLQAWISGSKTPIDRSIRKIENMLSKTHLIT
ncbi:MAG: helix-turn-helix transcriptional regulator, partial [Desulfuromonadaceae bacterium]|nr:helix-turn-helix transcriptional regulator [Desulfuromonadaceae bacterium]